jgi:hypothetical protein
MLPPQEILKIGGTTEAAGVLHSLFYSTGLPGAAAAPAPGLAGAALTSYAGQIPWTNPVSGNSYLARLQLTSTTACRASLVDRLWHNSGLVVTTTTAQTINSVTWPARDRNGTTAGDQVMVAVEVRTATTNASAVTNMTMSYTNSDGVAGRTATITSFPATAAVGSFIPFQLQAGDNGIQSIQTITLGTSLAAGAIHLVAYRTLAQMELILANTGASIDAITGGFVRFYDSSVPFLIYLPTATTATTLSGMLIITQG